MRERGEKGRRTFEKEDGEKQSYKNNDAECARESCCSLQFSKARCVRICAQFVDREHNGKLEFQLASANYFNHSNVSLPFEPGDPVFVIHTRWVAEWAEFAARSDKQPGPISNNKVLAISNRTLFLDAELSPSS